MSKQMHKKRGLTISINDSEETSSRGSNRRQRDPVEESKGSHRNSYEDSSQRSSRNHVASKERRRNHSRSKSRKRRHMHESYDSGEQSYRKRRKNSRHRESKSKERKRSQAENKGSKSRNKTRGPFYSSNPKMVTDKEYSKKSEESYEDQEATLDVDNDPIIKDARDIPSKGEHTKNNKQNMAFAKPDRKASRNTSYQSQQMHAEKPKRPEIDKRHASQEDLPRDKNKNKKKRELEQHDQKIQRFDSRHNSLNKKKTRERESVNSDSRSQSDQSDSPSDKHLSRRCAHGKEISKQKNAASKRSFFNQRNKTRIDLSQLVPNEESDKVDTKSNVGFASPNARSNSSRMCFSGICQNQGSLLQERKNQISDIVFDDETNKHKLQVIKNRERSSVGESQGYLNIASSARRTNREQTAEELLKLEEARKRRISIEERLEENGDYQGNQSQRLTVRSQRSVSGSKNSKNLYQQKLINAKNKSVLVEGTGERSLSQSSQRGGRSILKVQTSDNIVLKNHQKESKAKARLVERPKSTTKNQKVQNELKSNDSEVKNMMETRHLFNESLKESQDDDNKGRMFQDPPLQSKIQLDSSMVFPVPRNDSAMTIQENMATEELLRQNQNLNQTQPFDLDSLGVQQVPDSTKQQAISATYDMIGMASSTTAPTLPLQQLPKMPGKTLYNVKPQYQLAKALGKVAIDDITDSHSINQLSKDDSKDMMSPPNIQSTASIKMTGPEEQLMRGYEQRVSTKHTLFGIRGIAKAKEAARKLARMASHKHHTDHEHGNQCSSMLQTNYECSYRRRTFKNAMDKMGSKEIAQSNILQRSHQNTEEDAEEAGLDFEASGHVSHRRIRALRKKFDSNQKFTNKNEFQQEQEKIDIMKQDESRDGDGDGTPSASGPEDGPKNDEDSEEGSNKQSLCACLYMLICGIDEEAKEEIEAEANRRRNQVAGSNFHEVSRMRTLEREMSEIQRLQEQRIIKQNHPMRQNWDIFVMFLAIYNSIQIPIEIAFWPTEEQQQYSVVDAINNITDLFFVLDIVLNFQTTSTDEFTGEELDERDEIAANYLKFQFWIDLASAIPFDMILLSILDVHQAKQFSFLQMLKLIRILRLQKIINYMAATDEVKVSLKLMRSVFMLIFYIHLNGCLWFYIVKQDRSWIPPQWAYYGIKTTIYDADGMTQWLISFYNAVLALTGNDLYPGQNNSFGVLSIMLIVGAFYNAQIVGTLTLLAANLNRRSQNFQEKLDVANTSMKNMAMPPGITQAVRDFLMSTQANLDNQIELNQFLDLINKNLRDKVQRVIFKKAIQENSIFEQNEGCVDQIIADIETMLVLPDDTIFQQGSKGNKLYFMAKGECQVGVLDHMYKLQMVRQVDKGQFFGEVALIFDINRTATVVSSNYCTIATITQVQLYGLFHNYPDIYRLMKQQAISYNSDDRWKQFKKLMLRQIDYLQEDAFMQDEDDFFNEIQFHMQEETFHKGAMIVEQEAVCEAIIFVVQGRVDLEIVDEVTGDRFILDTLQQGDIIGQYGALYTAPFLFMARAVTQVRLLYLPAETLIEHRYQMPYLQKALEQGTKFCDDNGGPPILDYKIYSKEGTGGSLKERWMRTVRRAKIVAKLEASHQDRFLSLMRNMQTAMKEQQKQEDRRAKLKEEKRQAEAERMNQTGSARPKTSMEIIKAAIKRDMNRKLQQERQAKNIQVEPGTTSESSLELDPSMDKARQKANIALNKAMESRLMLSKPPVSANAIDASPHSVNILSMSHRRAEVAGGVRSSNLSSARRRSSIQPESNRAGLTARGSGLTPRSIMQSRRVSPRGDGTQSKPLGLFSQRKSILMPGLSRPTYVVDTEVSASQPMKSSRNEPLKANPFFRKLGVAMRDNIRSIMEKKKAPVQTSPPDQTEKAQPAPHVNLQKTFGKKRGGLGSMEMTGMSGLTMTKNKSILDTNQRPKATRVHQFFTNQNAAGSSPFQNHDSNSKPIAKMPNNPFMNVVEPQQHQNSSHLPNLPSARGKTRFDDHGIVDDMERKGDQGNLLQVDKPEGERIGVLPLAHQRLDSFGPNQQQQLLQYQNQQMQLPQQHRNVLHIANENDEAVQQQIQINQQPGQHNRASRNTSNVVSMQQPQDNFLNNSGGANSAQIEQMKREQQNWMNNHH